MFLSCAKVTFHAEDAEKEIEEKISVEGLGKIGPSPRNICENFLQVLWKDLKETLNNCSVTDPRGILDK